MRKGFIVEAARADELLREFQTRGNPRLKIHCLQALLGRND